MSTSQRSKDNTTVNRFVPRRLAALSLLFPLFLAHGGLAQEHPAAQSDRELVQAAAKGDAAMLGKLLDAEFTWTDTEGRTLSRAEFLNALPKPALGDEAGVNQTRQTRAQVEAIMSSREKIHVLRVWAKRGADWRLLLHHEVALGRESAGPADAGARECDNPCKTVPYKPKNESEQAILTSWEELETAVATRDSFNWAAHIASEFTMLAARSGSLRANV